MTIDSTCPLTATPLPVTAALTSLGVCVATGSPRRAAATITTAAACAVPITVRTLCWLKTRSTATASGVTRSSHRSTSASIASRRRAGSSSLAVRTIPTATRRSGAPGAPSTAPKPHLVSPGSTPSTRSGTHLARDRGSALSSHPATTAEGPPRRASHVPNICSDPTNLATSSIEPVETRRRDISSGCYSPGEVPVLISSIDRGDRSRWSWAASRQRPTR